MIKIKSKNIYDKSKSQSNLHLIESTEIFAVENALVFKVESTSLFE